jgi:hypothetical protein
MFQMMTCLRVVCVLTVCLMSGAAAAQDAQAFYVGGDGDDRLHDVMQLSDGTFLMAGSSTDLSWLPAGVTPVSLGGDLPQSVDPTSHQPVLLHVSEDLATVLAAVVLPPDAADAFHHLKTTSMPGEATGDLYVSGIRPGPGRRGGYFIARLDNNFVNGTPTALEWNYDVGATRTLARFQPWDVGSDGKVIYVTGEPYGYNWLSIHRLTAGGEQDVVPQWRRHWGTTPNGETTEFGGAADEFDGELSHSGIVLKVWGRHDFRSWSEADFNYEGSDGNGGVQIGRWPFDAMFDGYYDPETDEVVEVHDNGRGYFGYRWGSNPTAMVGAVVIDRRDNSFYLGGNNQSRLPPGQPDFEPWVVAMDADGELRWWRRLYPESEGVSTPDQYVDALAIDYSVAPDAAPGALVAVARAHGNNVNNFFQGDQVNHPDNPGRAFQNQFTGTHGNMHFSHLSRWSLEGTLTHACYFAEYGEGRQAGDGFADPLVSHWPSFGSGWPDLNTTRVQPHSLQVDAEGNVLLTATGRRVITTRNAYQEMPSPNDTPRLTGRWSDFVRVYSPDLTRLRYSSLVQGQWDTQTGRGGGGVDLQGAFPTRAGVVVVGISEKDRDSGQATGEGIPQAGQPGWASDTRVATEAVVAHLPFERE